MKLNIRQGRLLEVVFFELTELAAVCCRKHLFLAGPPELLCCELGVRPLGP